MALGQSIFGRRKKKAGQGKKILYLLLAIYVIAALFFSVGMMFYIIAKPLITFGLGWLVIGLATLMNIAVSFVGSIFMAEQQLFEAKDNDLLLSMPIPPSYILASRIILILVSNLLFGLFIMLPAFIVYCIFIPRVTVSMVIIFILVTVLAAVLATALTCACGWIVALVTSRLRRKNLISTVLIMALLFAYMYFYMNLQNYAQRLIAEGTAFAAALSKAFPPAYLAGAAVDGSNYLYLLGFALWAFIPFGIVYLLLSKSFIRIATTRRGEVRVKYKERELKISSVRAALTKKEMERFFSLPMYIFNCGLGAVMTLILAGALVVKKDIIIDQFSQIPGLGISKVAMILCGVVCFAVSMNDITAPSISLEAKTLWILKSMPIRPSDVFFGKVAASLIITLPPVILSSVVICAVIRPTPLVALLFILTPIVLQVFISLYGIVLNLKLPRFEWISEVAVIKQSGSVMAAVFGGMAVVGIPALVYVFLASAIPTEVYLIMCIAFFAVLAFLMYAYLRRSGEEIFQSF